MCLFLLVPNVADDAAIRNLCVLGDFVLVDEKKVLVTCMPPSTQKSRPVSFDTPLLHFSLSGTLIRLRFYWAFTVSGQMTGLAFLGSKESSTVTWSITSQSSPSGRTRGAGLIGVEIGVLMVATWFAMRSCPWRCLALLLYL